MFWLYVQVEVNQNLLKVWYWPFVFTLYKAFWKNKNRSGTSLPSSFFRMIFEEKYLSRYILSTDQILLPDCMYFLIYWAICALELFVSGVLNFGINLNLLIKPFFCITEKPPEKCKYIKNWKRFLRGFFLTRFFPYKGKIFIRENTCQ